MKDIKIKVIKLDSSSSIVSKDYSKTIEDLVNTNVLIKIEEKLYELEDFDIKKIEDKSYIILRYARI